MAREGRHRLSRLQPGAGRIDARSKTETDRMTDAARHPALPQTADEADGTFPLGPLCWGHALGAAAGVAAVIAADGAWTGLLIGWLVAVLSVPLLCLLPAMAAEAREAGPEDALDAWRRDLDAERAAAQRSRDAA
jgi:hypothetical protein